MADLIRASDSAEDNLKTKQFLFICGCPRSGTTAMWRLLASDPRFAIGVERYGTLFFDNMLTPSLFSKDRFSSVMPGDTFYTDLEKFNSNYSDILSRIEDATFVGDKIPMLYKRLDWLSKTVPGALVIFLVRNIFDVASSYEARANNKDDQSWSRKKRTGEAIHDWHQSLVSLRNAPKSLKIMPVIYEKFFFEESSLDGLCEFLGIQPSDGLSQGFRSIRTRAIQLEGQRARNLSMDNVMRISAEAPFGLYRELLTTIG